MTGVRHEIEGAYGQCAGCTLAVPASSSGAESLTIEHESASASGDIFSLRLTFHSLNCFIMTAQIEKWKDVGEFRRWAEERVRAQTRISKRFTKV